MRKEQNEEKEGRKGDNRTGGERIRKERGRIKMKCDKLKV